MKHPVIGITIEMFPQDMIVAVAVWRDDGLLDLDRRYNHVTSASLHRVLQVLAEWAKRSQ